MDIAEWLRGLGLDQYLPAFRANDIDEVILRRLTAEDLRELGVASIGHRRRLLDAITALRAEAPPIHSRPPPPGCRPLLTLPACRGGKGGGRGGSGAAAADGDVLRSGRFDAAVDAL